jgi:hypothetical protein
MGGAGAADRAGGEPRRGRRRRTGPRLSAAGAAKARGVRGVGGRGRGLQGRPGATVAGAGGGRHCGGWGSHDVEWTVGAAGGTKKQRETG